MEQRHPWQSAILASLVAARGLRLNAGSLFANVMDQIPLHHGGRAANRGRPAGAERRERVLSATELRWTAFRQYVLSLDVDTDPPVGANVRKGLTMRHFILPKPTYCPECGEVYIGRKGRPLQGHAGCVPKPQAEELPALALGRVVYLSQFRR